MGRAHAIACLVGGGAWKTWARLLRRLDAQGIDIGLHLDLTECPLLPRSRRALRGLIADSLLRRLDAQAVRAEIRAQLDAFEQALGHAPAFVDGHQHVHQLAGVRHPLLDELEQRAGPSRPWLRSTRGAGGLRTADAGSWRGLVKPRVIELLGAHGLAEMARRLGFAQNRRLLGVYDFQGGAQRYLRLLAAWLGVAGNADLLLCHPSLPLDHLPSHDSLMAARQTEFKVLCGPEFGALLRDTGIALRPMSQLLAPGGPQLNPARPQKQHALPARAPNSACAD